MPKLRPERVQDNMRILLLTARALMGDKGLEGTAVCDIARRAGVSDGFLYRYFPSKRALLNEMLADFVTELSDRIINAVAPKRGAQVRLHALIHEYLKHLAENHGIARLLIAELRNTDPQTQHRIITNYARYRDLIGNVLNDVCQELTPGAQLDVSAFQDMVVGTIEHCVWRHDRRKEKLIPRIHANRITAMVIGAMSAMEMAEG